MKSPIRRALKALSFGFVVVTIGIAVVVIGYAEFRAMGIAGFKVVLLSKWSVWTTLFVVNVALYYAATKSSVP
jgi:uncharacterized membrane-anchored protein YitT (DUF2179 family)